MSVKYYSDIDRVRGMSEDEAMRNAVDDLDAPPLDDAFFARARVVWPEKKATVTIRLDENIVKFFKSKGKGYQGRINAVLRAYVEHQAGIR